MLVLQRKLGEKLLIGENVEVTIQRISGQYVRLGVDAPPDVKILRDELSAKRVDQFDPFVVPVTKEWLDERLGKIPCQEINPCCFRWRPRAVSVEFEFTWETDAKKLLVCVQPTLNPGITVFVVQYFNPTQGEVDQLCRRLLIKVGAVSEPGKRAE